MFTGLEVGEHITAQCKSSRMKKDQDQMAAISKFVDESCNPFSIYFPDSLINIATGHAARKPTEEYLLNTLKRVQKKKGQSFKRSGKR